jgi:hypothetical protein
MGTSVYFNNQGATREQMLIEDMVIESIKNHGIDVYYIPRESQSEIDKLFGDDPVKTYRSAYPMEMFLETFNDFEGNQEFFSKFGLEVQKTARLGLARRTFEKYLPSDVREFPKEGDLIWMPTLQKLMEVKFVEQEKNFFQLGKGVQRGAVAAGRTSTTRGAHDQLGRLFPYMYELSVEMFKYNGEFLDTGIPDIDNLQDIYSFGIQFTLNAGGVGSYGIHEVVYQGASLAAATSKGYVSSWDLPNKKLTVRNIKGVFANGTLVVGATTGSRWTITGGNQEENANDTYDDNVIVETESDNILDWTETNPFGMPNEQF